MIDKSLVEVGDRLISDATGAEYVVSSKSKYTVWGHPLYYNLDHSPNRGAEVGLNLTRMSLALTEDAPND